VISRDARAITRAKTTCRNSVKSVTLMREAPYASSKATGSTSRLGSTLSLSTIPFRAKGMYRLASFAATMSSSATVMRPT
jgi:hypothetical protein